MELFHLLTLKLYWLLVTWYSLNTLRVRHRLSNIIFGMLLLMLLIVVVFQIIASKSNLRVSKRLNIVDSVPVFLFFPSRGGGIQSAFFICIKHVPTPPSFIVKGLGLNFRAVTSVNNIVYGKTLTIY